MTCYFISVIAILCVVPVFLLLCRTQVTHAMWDIPDFVGLYLFFIKVSFFIDFILFFTIYSHFFHKNFKKQASMKKISKSAYNLPVFFINSSFSLDFMKLQIQLII